MNVAVPKDNWLDKKNTFAKLKIIVIYFLLDKKMKIRMAISFSNFALSYEYSIFSLTSLLSIENNGFESSFLRFCDSLDVLVSVFIDTLFTAFMYSKMIL